MPAGVDTTTLRKLETAALLATWLHQDHWDAHDAVLARISSSAR